MANGFDCDTHLTASVIQQAKATGHIAAGRYLKNLTAAEVDLCRENDFGLWLISEGMGDRATMQTGRAGGLRDATAALRQANTLGVPQNVPIASAVDFDADGDDVPGIDTYMGGFATGLAAHPLIVYGDGAVLTSDLPAGSRAYVAGAGGWEGTHAYLAKTKAPALVQHGTATMFGISVDLVDINDESVIWYPGRDPATSLETQPAPPPSGPPLPSLKTLQQALIRAGAAIEADGIYGPATAAALASYYEANPG